MCQSLINSLGYSANSHFGASQAFVGGGCAHHVKHNWYQVMNPMSLDDPATCDAKETSVPGRTPWQRMCACTAVQPTTPPPTTKAPPGNLITIQSLGVRDVNSPNC